MPVCVSKKHLACKHFVPWLTRKCKPATFAAWLIANPSEWHETSNPLEKKKHGGLECISCCVTIVAWLFTLQKFGKVFPGISCDASVSFSQVPSAMLSWERALRNLAVTTHISWRPLAHCLLLWESGWNCWLFGKCVPSLVARHFSVTMKTLHYVKCKDILIYQLSLLVWLLQTI